MIVLCKMLHFNLKHKPLNHKQLGRGQSRAGNLEKLLRKLSQRKPFLLIFRGLKIPFINQVRSTAGFQTTYFSALHGLVQCTAFNWDLDFHYDVWKDLITESRSTETTVLAKEPGTKLRARVRVEITVLSLLQEFGISSSHHS